LSAVVAIRAASSRIDTLAAAIGFEAVFWQASFGVGRFDAPLQRKPLVQFFADGGFVLGRNDSSRVDFYSEAGRVQRSIILPLPAPMRSNRRDRAAYADSIMQSAEREMIAQRYGESLKARFREEVSKLAARTALPALRQSMDLLVLSEADQTLWVLLPATTAAYTRTWLVCRLEDGRQVRRIVVPHRAAVLDAAVQNGALYTIERSIDGIPSIAKYSSR
jgi:hypothetical protein